MPAAMTTSGSVKGSKREHRDVAPDKTLTADDHQDLSTFHNQRVAMTSPRSLGSQYDDQLFVSHHKDTEFDNEEHKREVNVVTPSPQSRRKDVHVSPTPERIEPTKLARIRQNHLANKRREQMKSRSPKLPELNENSELEIPETMATDGSGSPRPGGSSPKPTSMVAPHISVTPESKDSSPIAPPHPSADEPVNPSLPESFLKNLGLLSKSRRADSEDDKDESVDQLQEKDLESKFVSLSLAFKTDKLSLDQRVAIQERTRDLSEQNIDKELRSLRESLESLSQLVSDERVLDVVQKIKQHIDVIEQSAARVSSRAEVYGAVQQERRILKAMEVMVLYTENLRRLREREESEVQEARKVLSERASGSMFAGDMDSSTGRRSMSVCGFNASGRPMRRRSEVALPRVLGGSGAPSMVQTANLDPKSRFQSAVASTSMRNAVTSTMRRASLERQRSSSVSSTSSMSPTSSLSPTSPLAVFRSPTKDRYSDGAKEKGDSPEEDAYRKGYEEGLKAKLSQQLCELREQQNSISDNLEAVMDRVDQSQQDEQHLLDKPSQVDSFRSAVSNMYTRATEYDWRANKTVIRTIVGILLLILAFLLVFISPTGCGFNLQYFSKPPH